MSRLCDRVLDEGVQALTVTHTLVIAPSPGWDAAIAEKLEKEGYEPTPALIEEHSAEVRAYSAKTRSTARFDPRAFADAVVVSSRLRRPDRRSV